MMMLKNVDLVDDGNSHDPHTKADIRHHLWTSKPAQRKVLMKPPTLTELPPNNLHIHLPP